MKAFLLAAGRGTRLQPLTDTTPKCLVTIGRVPLLQIWLQLCRAHGITDVLVELLHTSDDNTAEMLVKEIGFATSGQGTRTAGLATVGATLAGWGVPLTSAELRDGSGLDRGNRTTCAALAALVSSTPVAEQLVGLMPVAGRDGTMSEVLLGTPAEGLMHAKTGTLTDVKALTGSQPGAHGRLVPASPPRLARGRWLGLLKPARRRRS